MLWKREKDVLDKGEIKTLTNKLDRDAWCTISLIRYGVSPTDLR